MKSLSLFSRSVLLSGDDSFNTAKQKNAAAYYRAWLAASKLAKHYSIKAAICSSVDDQIGRVLNTSIAADYDYELTLLALKLANNKADSRHTLFAAMNKARANANTLKKQVLALRDAGRVI
jgi:hypothetical protein